MTSRPCQRAGRNAGVTSLTPDPLIHSSSPRPGGDRVLLTADGVPVVAWHDPAEGSGRELGLVVAHGFTVHCGRPGVRAVVAALGRYGGVVSFDFRGHGRSGGLST